jgi:hypothetical protein
VSKVFVGAGSLGAAPNCARGFAVTFAAALVSAVMLPSCTRDVLHVQVLPLDRPNPNSYVFERPVAEVHEHAKTALSAFGVVEMIFGKRPYRDPLLDPDAVEYADYFVVEEPGDSLGSFREVLQRPGNRDDLYVHSWSDPLWPSPVYRGGGAGLPFIAEFHVHLAALGPNRTMVTVAAMNTQILNGMTWAWGPCGPGYGWKPDPVAPTTIEEYMLLRYLGLVMHVQGMPEVAVPARR